MIVRRSVLAGAAMVFAAFSVRPAIALAAQSGLTLRGRFGKAGQAGEVRNSMADLDALPQTSFSTGSPWSKGVVKYSGVSVKDFLAHFDAQPTALRLIALNDYMVEANAADLLGGEALLATRQNDQLMPISDKGPVFLIFPFDARSDLKHQTYYSRCVWQLTEIEIVT